MSIRRRSGPVRIAAITANTSRACCNSASTSSDSFTLSGAQTATPDAILQSNTLDATSGLNGTFVDANYPQLEYRQRSDQDRRHMMTMSFVWKPDYFDRYNRVVKTALNGWSVSGIWTANSGQPFTGTTGNDNYFSGLGNNRPSIVPGAKPHTLKSSSRVGEMAQWFDKTAYCRPGVDAGCPRLRPSSTAWQHASGAT